MWCLCRYYAWIKKDKGRQVDGKRYENGNSVVPLRREKKKKMRNKSNKIKKLKIKKERKQENPQCIGKSTTNQRQTCVYRSFHEYIKILLDTRHTIT